VEDDVHLPGGHEGSHVLHLQLEAALVHSGDFAFDELADFEVFPGYVLRQRALAVEDEEAFAGVIAFDDELHLLPDGGLLLELLHRDDALVLAAEIDEGVVFLDGDDASHPRAAPAATGPTLLGRAGRGHLRLVRFEQALDGHAAEGGFDLAVERGVGVGPELLFVRVLLRLFGHY
jgi:hypothetical protein